MTEDRWVVVNTEMGVEDPELSALANHFDADGMIWETVKTIWLGHILYGTPLPEPEAIAVHIAEVRELRK